MKDHFPGVSRELERVSKCGKKIGVHVCFKCGTVGFKSISCKSRLCPRCSKRLRRERVMHAMAILGPYLESFKHWSHVVFTVPDSLRLYEWGWDDLKSLRSTATRICRDLVGSGGASATHTFSSEAPERTHLHVHVIVFGRRLLNWEDLRKRWAKYLKRRFGYEGPVDVYENWFLNGREKKKVREVKLRHRVRYMLRLPDPSPGTYWHYELIAGHQSYCYFGLVINDFQKKRATKERSPHVCPTCGGEMRFIGMLDDFDGTWVDSYLMDVAIENYPELVDLLATIQAIRGKWAFEGN